MSEWYWLALVIHCATAGHSSNITSTLRMKCFILKDPQTWQITSNFISFFACLTHSPALHQNSKNIQAIAYLCFLLFHVIVVAIVSFLSWFRQCFSIDYAITEVATSDLPTFQLIAKIHKTASEEREYLKEKNHYSFHSLLHVTGTDTSASLFQKGRAGLTVSCHGAFALSAHLKSISPLSLWSNVY